MCIRLFSEKAYCDFNYWKNIKMLYHHLRFGKIELQQLESFSKKLMSDKTFVSLQLQ